MPQAFEIGRNVHTFSLANATATIFYPDPQTFTAGFAGVNGGAGASIFAAHPNSKSIIRSMYLGKGTTNSVIILESNDGTTEYAKIAAPDVVPVISLTDFPIPAGGWRIRVTGASAGSITIVYEVL
jgi:hypothetical protein